MTGRLRYVLAAAFAALFFLVPTGPELDPSLATLEVRSWLLTEGDDRPEEEKQADRDAGKDVVDRSTFGLAITKGEGLDAEAVGERGMRVRFLGGDESQERRAEREAQLGRALREFLRSTGKRAVANRLPVNLEVRVGDNGFRGVLTDDGGELLSAIEYQKDPKEGYLAPGYYPDRWSLLPALVAIVLAILSGKVIPSLLLGCLTGAFVYAGNLGGMLTHVVVDTVGSDILQSQFQLEIIGFVIFLFMAIGIMSRSGGMRGMVEWVRRFAKGPVSTQFSTWIIGLLVFFDDYSNCIITGTTMRPVADKNRIAREKLAYIVDSTAAPIAGISIFSTWVAYEISQFAPQLPEVTKPDGSPYAISDGFTIFVQTLPFRFYCLFTIVMVFLTIATRREFGPMLSAARRAHHDGKPSADDAELMVKEGLSKLEPDEKTPHRGWNALGPLLFLISSTIALIFHYGTSELKDAQRSLPFFERMAAILSNGESQRALCWASAAAAVLATLLAVGQKLMSWGDAAKAAYLASKSLIFAIVILILAWSIGEICGDLGTAKFLTAAFGESFAPWLLPATMFGLSSLVAFSTGTSYGTMAILLPNVVVLSHTMGTQDPELGGTALMLLTIGAVLEGSIFGDHCSPISDTTVLSSVASGSDHLHHVRTQAPYAVTVMLVSMIVGYIPIALYGLDFWPDQLGRRVRRTVPRDACLRAEARRTDRGFGELSQLTRRRGSASTSSRIRSGSRSRANARPYQAIA